MAACYSASLASERDSLRLSLARLYGAAMGPYRAAHVAT